MDPTIKAILEENLRTRQKAAEFWQSEARTSEAILKNAQEHLQQELDAISAIEKLLTSEE